MIRVAFLILIPLICLSSCRSKTDIKSEIAALELALQQDPNPETLESLIGLYQEISAKSEGEERLEYVWKAGEAARSARQFTLAAASFEEIYNQHPDSPQASKALFLHAFMCDEDQKEFDKAKELYEAFLEKYPSSDFSDDAQFLLQNLGKSDEEMLELLSQKNQE